MTDKITNIAKHTSLWIFLGLLGYMPLHIFLSTWLGTSFHVLGFAKIAKDIVMVGGFGLAFIASVRQPWFGSMVRNKLVWLMIAYAALTVLLGVLKPTDHTAEILGIVYNTRFFLFFIYALLIAQLFSGKKVRCLAIKTVLVSGAVVLVFGLLQYFVLPANALQHVGYSRANGVLPAFFIDDKPDLPRIMSTLRDPNSLGSYLIIIGMLALGMIQATKRRVRKIQLGLYVFATVVCMWLTFSRDAQLGFLIALGTFLLLADTKLKGILLTNKKWLVGGVVAVAAVVGLGLVATWHTYTVQNILFHADKSTKSEDPNQLRKRFWKESITKIEHHPLGSGPGTAGLASIKNHVQGVILNENYYLQIGEEVGILGLLLFLAILSVTAWKLYQLRDSHLALALLASFVALAFTNFLVHIWSTEAVAYTWWGLAGIAIANTKNDKNTTKRRKK